MCLLRLFTFELLTFLVFSLIQSAFWDESYFLKLKDTLAVGILSAPINFVQRETIRKTWFNEETSKDGRTSAWFIVGEYHCQIPPEYRLNEYGCEKWKIDLSGLEEYFVTSKEIINASSVSHTFHNGFSFQVNFPVVITKLGVITKFLSSNEVIRVCLLDLQSKEILTQATIRQNTSSSNQGYTYSEVDQLLLPKGYQGLVLTEGYLRTEITSSVYSNNGGGAVTIERIYNSASHLDSFQCKSNCSLATSAEFFIQDIKQLENIKSIEEQANRKWDTLNRNLKKKLIEESTQYNDILFVDMVDTYRNLPVKVLHFLLWLVNNQNFSYVLKIDDDSVIDLNYLQSTLKNKEIFDPAKHWIWSRFRKNWPLNYIGKWADSEYKSTLYPSFPCGAGYVLSHETASWLSLNSKYLYPYQGEDVSMGIWLSAVNPTLIEDEKWNCDSQCNANSYNAAQLSIEHMYESWKNYQECQDLCAC